MSESRSFRPPCRARCVDELGNVLGCRIPSGRHLRTVGSVLDRHDLVEHQHSALGAGLGAGAPHDVGKIDAAVLGGDDHPRGAGLTEHVCELAGP